MVVGEDVCCFGGLVCERCDDYDGVVKDYKFYVYVIEIVFKLFVDCL